MKKRIKKLLGLPTTPIEKFHQITKIKKMSPELSYEDWPNEWKQIHIKEYPRLDKFILPDPLMKNKLDLTQALLKRESVNFFSPQELSIEKLSYLLHFSAGLKNYSPNKQINLSNILEGKRFYPSAGGRYPLEIYFLSQNTELPKGLYHYNLRLHSLEKLLLTDKLNFKKYFRQEWTKQAGGLIIITALFKRSSVKYSDRSYRHILIEAGHLGQNIYLNATALKMTVCPIGGYIDDNINKLLDVDGTSEAVLYIIAVGEIGSQGL